MASPQVSTQARATGSQRLGAQSFLISMPWAHCTKTEPSQRGSLPSQGSGARLPMRIVQAPKLSIKRASERTLKPHPERDSVWLCLYLCIKLLLFPREICTKANAHHRRDEQEIRGSAHDLCASKLLQD